MNAASIFGVMPSTVTELGQLSNRELGAKNLRLCIVAFGANELTPESGAVGRVGHAFYNVGLLALADIERGGEATRHRQRFRPS
jgi:hypothetical protein